MAACRGGRFEAPAPASGEGSGCGAPAGPDAPVPRGGKGEGPCESGKGASGGIAVGRYAAIDIGTVTCRMLVADVTNSGLCELAREYAITNLGEGVDATGALKPEAMQRVAQAIDRYLQVLDGLQTPDHPSIAITAMATSAARDASNADDFATLLKERGIALAVIPGEREAALSFRGASCDFAGECLMVVDIGGGSTEVVVGRAGEDPRWTHSFNVGCRRVTEKFFASDPPTEGEIRQAHAWILGEMKPFFAKIRAGEGFASGASAAAGGAAAAAGCADDAHDGTRGFALDRLVAVAGTATSIVSIREHMETYDAARVHKAQVSRAGLDSVCERLRSVTLDERKRVVGLDPGRAPVIVAGLLILQDVLALAGVDSFTASECDILHGMVLESAATFMK